MCEFLILMFGKFFNLYFKGNNLFCNEFCLWSFFICFNVRLFFNINLLDLICVNFDICVGKFNFILILVVSVLIYVFLL